MLPKPMMTYQLQNDHYIFVRYLFSHLVIFLFKIVTHFILRLGYRFADSIR